MLWPTDIDYQDAIQNPHRCFRDPELKSGSPVLDVLGFPKPSCGTFASVYQINCVGSKYAVRCFRHQITDQQQRYSEISNHLDKIRLPYMVNFKFFAQGISIKGNNYPILKMEWIEGEQLDKYIERMLDNSNALNQLADDFCKLVSDLRNNFVAHCDLQHGNIMVVNGKLRLIDYDGMFVPGLSNKSSQEIGHRNFQHPLRDKADDFGLHVDNFSSWVIYLSLIAVSRHPNIWRSLGPTGAGDDALLFQRKDFENPNSSAAFQALRQINDKDLELLIKQFRSFIDCHDLSQIVPLPGLDKDPPKKTATTPIEQPKTQTARQPTGASWVWDHIPVETKAITSTFGFERVCLAGLAFSLMVLIAFSASGVMPVIIFPLAGIGLAGACFFLLFKRFGSLTVVLEKNEKAGELSLLEKDYKTDQHRMEALESEKQKIFKDQNRKIQAIEDNIGKSTEAEKNELDKMESDRKRDLTKIDSELNRLTNAENSEIAAALKDIQSTHLKTKLSTYYIHNAKIPGIGPKLTSRLIAGGIRTAGDIEKVSIGTSWSGNFSTEVAYIHLSSGRRTHIDGIGAQRAQAILLWRQRLESQFASSIPQKLPQTQEATIRSKNQSKRQALATQKNSIEQIAAQKKNVVKAKYEQEQNTLSKQLQDTKKGFKVPKKEMDHNIDQTKKILTDKQWSLERAKRELDAFSQVKFIKYLKDTVMWRKKAI